LPCALYCFFLVFFFSSRRRHTRFSRDWSSDVCSSDLWANAVVELPLDYSVDLEDAKPVIQRSIDEFADNPEFAPKIIERPSINRSEERRVGKECRSRRSP